MMNEQKTNRISLLITLLLASYWSVALFVIGTDQHQGEVYRIIYLHVPSAFTAFMCSAVLFVHSVLGLKNREQGNLFAGVAAAEVGFIFTIITLATGSIWGRPTWGTWWTWDARLTTTLILALLYGGYLFLYHSLDNSPQKIVASSILGILIFIDVPIIYKSVTWWRTLHQPQTILRPGGSSTIDSDMLILLLTGIGLMWAVAFWLIKLRRRNLHLQEQLLQGSMAIGEMG